MSSEALLRDLSEACMYLESDKLTDRKRNAEKVKRIIQIPQVAALLDANKCKEISYTVIFKNVQGYLYKESELARVKWTDLTSTTQASSAQKLKDVSSLVHFVVKASCRNGPKIKCSELISSILIILKRNFQRLHFGSVYLEILITDVLAFDKYTKQIISTKYKELLSCCTSIYLDPSESINLSQVITAIKSLITAIIKHCDPFQHQYFFDFLKPSLDCIRNARSSTLLENALWCQLHFSIWQAKCSRKQVCEVGRETLPAIIGFLSSKKAKDETTTYALQYCLLQIKLHHDLDDENEFHRDHLSYDKADWLSVLKDMLEAVQSKIISIQMLRKRSSVMKCSSLEEAFVELTSNLLHVLTDKLNFFPTSNTQNITSDSNTTVQFCDASFISKYLPLPSMDMPLVTNTWLKIISKRLRSYPGDLLVDEAEFAEYIHKILLLSKCNNVSLSALEALSSLLYSLRVNETDHLGNSAILPQLWETAKRLALSTTSVQSSSSLSDAAFSLMSVLITTNKQQKIPFLSSSDSQLRNIWPLISLTVIPTQSSLKFLFDCIESQGIVEVIRHNDTSNSTRDVRLVRPLRCGMLDWLFAHKEGEMNAFTEGLTSANAFNESQINNDDVTEFKLINIFHRTRHGSSGVPDVELLTDFIVVLCSKDPEQAISSCVVRRDNSSSENPSSQNRGLNNISKNKVLIDDLLIYAYQKLKSFLSNIFHNFERATPSGSNTMFEITYAMQLAFTLAIKLQLEESFVDVGKLDEILARAGGEVFRHDGLSDSDRKMTLEIWNKIPKIIELYSKVKKLHPGNQVPGEFQKLHSLCISTISSVLDCSTSGNLCSQSTQHNSTQISFDDDPIVTSSTVNGCKRKRNDNCGPPAKQTCCSSEYICSVMGDDYIEFIALAMRVLKDLVIGEFSVDKEVCKELYDTIFDEFDASSVIQVEVLMCFVKVFTSHFDALYPFQLCYITDHLLSSLRRHYQDQVICSSVLDALPNLVNSILPSDEEQSKQCVEDVGSALKVVDNLVEDDKYNKDVKVSFISCLTSLSRIFSFSDSDNSLMTKLGSTLKIVSFLADKNVSIGRFVAHLSRSLFEKTKRDSQLDQFFCAVFLHAKQVGRQLLAAVRESDADLCRRHDIVSSYLRFLAHLPPHPGHPIEREVALEISYFSASVLTAFSAVEKQECVVTMKRAISEMTVESAFMKHTSGACSSVLSSHLKYILYKWPQQDQLKDFPYYLHDCSSINEFTVKHKKEIFPLIVLRRFFEKKHLESSMKMFEPVSDLLPALMANFVCCFYGQGTTGDNRQLRFHQVLEFMARLESRMEVGVALREMINHSIGDVIIVILSYFRSESEVTSFPAPVMYFDIVDFATLKVCINSMLQVVTRGAIDENAVELDVDALRKILNSKPGKLQMFFLSLNDLLRSSKNFVETRRLLLVYKFTCSLLIGYNKDDVYRARDCVFLNIVIAMTQQLERLHDQVAMAKDLLQEECVSVFSICIDVLFDAFSMLLSDNSPSTLYLSCRDDIVVRFVSSIIAASRDLEQKDIADASKNKSNEFDESLQKLLKLIMRHRHTRDVYGEYVETSAYLNKTIVRKLIADEVPALTSDRLCDQLSKISSTQLHTSGSRLMLSDSLHQLAAIIKTSASSDYSRILETVLGLLEMVDGLIHGCEEAQLSAGKCLAYIGLKGAKGIPPVLRQDASPSIITILNRLYQCFMGGDGQLALASHSCFIKMTQTSKVRRIMEDYSSDEELKGLLNFLQTFTEVSSVPSQVFFPRDAPQALTERLSLWSCYHSNHDEWIRDLTTSLLCHSDVDYMRCLKEACSLSTILCDDVIPLLCEQLMTNRATRYELLQCINTFLLSTRKPDDNSIVELNEASARTVLCIVEHWRQHNITHASSRAGSHSKRSKRSGVRSLESPENDICELHNDDVDYLAAAKMSLVCHDSYSAMLYMELWTDAYEDKLRNQAGTRNVVVTSLGSESSNSSSYSETDYSSEASQYSKQQMLQGRALGTKCKWDMLQVGAGLEARGVILSIYDALDDVDGLRGCYSLSSFSTEDFARLCEKEGRWLDALKANELQVSVQRAPSDASSKILNCLDCCGLEHISNMYMKGIQETSSLFDEEFRELQFKKACELGDWDKSLFSHQTTSRGHIPSFHEHLHECLSSLYDDEERNFIISVNKLRHHSLSQLKLNQGRQIKLGQLNRTLAELQCAKEVEEVFTMLKMSQDKSDVIKRWSDLSKPSSSQLASYNDVASILSTRTSLLEILRNKCDHPEEEAAVQRLSFPHLLSCVRAASNHGHLQSAKRCLLRLKASIDRANKSPTNFILRTWRCRVKFEEILLLWKQKEKSFALASLNGLLQEFKCLESASGTLSREDTINYVHLHVEMLRTAGSWMADLRYEGPSVIMNDYLKRSAAIAEKSYNDGNEGLVDQLVMTYHRLAKFADAQYQELIQYKSSSGYTQKRSLAVASKCELASVQQEGHSMSRKTATIIEMNHHIDHQELSDVDAKALNFLLTAISNYMKCLKLSDQHNTLLHRVCALWFDNENLLDVNKLILSGHKTIPSYKYISLLYQLTARLHGDTKASSDYQQVLHQVISRITVDHPYHCLPVILALTNANKDETITSASNKQKSRKSTKHTNPDETTSPIGRILAIARRCKPMMVAGTEKLADTYIELANYDASAWKNNPNQKIPFTESLRISKLCDPKSRMCAELSGVVIPTVECPIDRRAKYEDLKEMVMFRNFQPHFQTCGGINLPKVVCAVGSDGKSRKHLVKGRDDLRQDAVLQQVFEMTNTLLSNRTGKDQLRIRVYKVVPLSRQSGLVEWCEGTIPIGTYLIGNPAQNTPGAHKRYRPTDPPVSLCRQVMSKAAKQTARLKFERYKEICNKFLPVFRYFFTEQFLAADEWFERRRTYTQSAAVSSIVGYILGLGDRHVQNILVDRATAELVHIDLGVAFEQGRCLPTPETVPFRLSRDIVDGMGLTGVEGTFRRCCEQTMDILRSSYDVIVPIVEVLLYDPLHDWTITPTKASRIQNIQLNRTQSSVLSGTKNQFLDDSVDDQQTNKLAERALLRLKEKLQGNEQGSVLSVKGQINFLIQQATDPFRLSQLFSGWQPYL